ncbi:MAG: DUF1460 domain-containing protein [Thermodesulfovibrionales bacterium]|nr:DUF1460 domain-containing protein [Thermodesulfovibrionales bacterium]
MTDTEILKLQTALKEKSIGERIAFWAESFLGTPYDNDPKGLYVTTETIVADKNVDCMYLTFRATELAMSNTQEEAIQIAMDKRFHSKGILRDGRVINYDNRFEFGEDMIDSGKWGREITSEIGKISTIMGSRGRNIVHYLTSEELSRQMHRLKPGDIIFLIKKPGKRVAGEIVGHIGIIKIEDRSKKVYLIHASGIKGKGGIVKKVLLKDYIIKMPFIGAKITRFN